MQDPRRLNFCVRTYQGHGKDSGAPIRTDQSNKFLACPGYLLHGTTKNSATPIIPQGLKTTERNAIHIGPVAFNETQWNYVRRKKTPLFGMIGGSLAVMLGSQSCFESPIGAILRDGNQNGTIPPEFIAALFVYESPLNSEYVLPRLDMDAVRAGSTPIPYFHGPLGDVPVPGFRNEHVVPNRFQRIGERSLYAPASVGQRDFDGRTDTPPPARLTPRPADVPRLTPRVGFVSAPASSTGDFRRRPNLRGGDVQPPPQTFPKIRSVCQTGIFHHAQVGCVQARTAPQTAQIARHP